MANNRAGVLGRCWWLLLGAVVLAGCGSDWEPGATTLDAQLEGQIRLSRVRPLVPLRRQEAGSAAGFWARARNLAARGSLCVCTPPLRNVAVTGPWMHDGAYTTLQAAVRHHLDAGRARANHDPARLDPRIRATWRDDAEPREHMLANLYPPPP